MPQDSDPYWQERARGRKRKSAPGAGARGSGTFRRSGWVPTERDRVPARARIVAPPLLTTIRAFDQSGPKAGPMPCGTRYGYTLGPVLLAILVAGALTGVGFGYRFLQGGAKLCEWL